MAVSAGMLGISNIRNRKIATYRKGPNNMDKMPKHVPVENSLEDERSTPERARVRRLVKKSEKRPKSNYQTNEDGQTVLSSKSVDDIVALVESFGSYDRTFINAQIGQLSGIVKLGDTDAKIAESLIAYHYALNPHNEIQSLLAGQIVATNHVALRMLARSLESNSLEVAGYFASRAHKAQSLLLRQLEVFNAMKNGGPTTQNVTVGKVEVQNGGQAVVGAVAAASGREKPKAEG